MKERKKEVLGLRLRGGNIIPVVSIFFSIILILPQYLKSGSGDSHGEFDLRVLGLRAARARACQDID